MKLRPDVLRLDITMPKLNGIAVAAGKAFFSPEISCMPVDDYLRRLEQSGVEDSYELVSLRGREVMRMPFARA